MKTSSEKTSLIVAIFLLASLSAFSQFWNDTSTFNRWNKPYNDIVKLHAAQGLWGYIPFTSEISVSYEFLTRSNQSFVLGIGYITKNWLYWINNKNFHDLNVDGYKGTLAYRWYVIPESRQPTGVYLSPSISYAEAIFDTGRKTPRTDYIKVSKYDISLNGGVQFLVGPVGLDLSMSVGRKDQVWTENESQYNFKTIDNPFRLVPYFKYLRIGLGLHLCLAI
jgi:hypothetical protein